MKREEKERENECETVAARGALYMRASSPNEEDGPAPIIGKTNIVKQINLGAAFCTCTIFFSEGSPSKVMRNFAHEALQMRVALNARECNTSISNSNARGLRLGLVNENIKPAAFHDVEVIAVYHHIKGEKLKKRKERGYIYIYIYILER